MANTPRNAVMVERHEPNFVQFKAGVSVEGILRSVESVNVKGSVATRYLLENGKMQIDARNGQVCAFHSEGTLSRFLGTTQIDERMALSDVGRYVIIKCIGEDTMVKRGENFMKVFEFSVTNGPVEWGPVRAGQAPDGTPEITDEDIPFL